MDIHNRLPNDVVQELESLLWEIDNFTGEWGKAIGMMGQVDEAHVVKLARKFIYRNNLIVVFDWGDWKEGRKFFLKDEKIKYNNLDKETVMKLLTTGVRADRFYTAFWVDLFNDGIAQQLFHRLYEIETTIDCQHKDGINGYNNAE
jgi:hypothetical protein